MENAYEATHEEALANITQESTMSSRSSKTSIALHHITMATFNYVSLKAQQVQAPCSSCDRCRL